MELTEIKGSVFGYNKKSVCEYISELNEIHSAELEAIKDSSDKLISQSEERISALSGDNAQLTADIESLKAEISELKDMVETLSEQKAAISADYENLLKESEELRAKSDVISTAIINAEKCASTMINDAGKRAQDMLDDAKDRVDTEVRRLEAAKEYITEVRVAVETALDKIDAELGGIVSDIDSKTDLVNRIEDRKSSVKEKFGVLEKSLFKRA